MGGLIVNRDRSRNQNDDLPNPPINPKHDDRWHGYFDEDLELRWLVDLLLEYGRFDPQVRAELRIKNEQHLLDTKRKSTSYSDANELQI